MWTWVTMLDHALYLKVLQKEDHFESIGFWFTVEFLEFDFFFFWEPFSANISYKSKLLENCLSI